MLISIRLLSLKQYAEQDGLIQRKLRFVEKSILPVDLIFYKKYLLANLS